MTGDSQMAGPSPRFPTYLLPSFSLPFHRRRQSSISAAACPSPPEETSLPALSSSPTDSAVSSPAESPQTPSFFPSGFPQPSDPSKSQPSHGRPDTERLSRVHPNTIRCSTCSTDFAFTSQIVSKSFTGRWGRAYLVSPPDPVKNQRRDNLVNLLLCQPEKRQLVTGSHVVADILCGVCRVKVGWKYIDAKEDSQKYKIGKFILETQQTVNYSSWEDVPAPEPGDLNMDPAQLSPDGELEAVDFDSEDSDDCEDVFMGVWDPLVAAKRRSRKARLSAK